MSERITAPFTPTQVENLNAWQHSNIMHPFTCANRGDGKHGQYAGDKGSLVATVRGWICLFCDYQQDWAHDFMAKPSTHEAFLVEAERVSPSIAKAIRDANAGVPIPRVDAVATKTVPVPKLKD